MKKILVFGLARTGISALKTLKLKGFDLGAIDDNIDEEKTKDDTDDDAKEDIVIDENTKL